MLSLVLADFGLGVLVGVVGAIFVMGIGFFYTLRRTIISERAFAEHFNKHTFYSGEAGPTEPPIITEKTDD